MTATKKCSYLLFGLILAAAGLLKLGPVLLAGLFSFMILHLTHRLLKPRLPDFVARWATLLIFLVTATGISWLFVIFLRMALARMPVILGSVIPSVYQMASSHGFELPFENLQELREMILDAIKLNLRQITQTSGLLTKGFFQVIVGVFVAVFCFFADRDETYQANLFDALRREMKERIRVFMLGFEKVIGAQVVISAINTCLTAIFLMAMGIPFVHFLVLTTFIFGVLPLIGNILSNTIIVGTALTLSPKHAAFALAYLVVIHKAEYFLNSKIVGGSINTPMWLTLLGILVGEVILGVPGIMLAPAMIHYIREELQTLPAQAS